MMMISCLSPCATLDKNVQRHLLELAFEHFGSDNPLPTVPQLLQFMEEDFRDEGHEKAQPLIVAWVILKHLRGEDLGGVKHILPKVFTHEHQMAVLDEQDEHA